MSSRSRQRTNELKSALRETLRNKSVNYSNLNRLAHTISQSEDEKERRRTMRGSVASKLHKLKKIFGTKENEVSQSAFRNVRSFLNTPESQKILQNTQTRRDQQAERSAMRQYKKENNRRRRETIVQKPITVNYRRSNVSSVGNVGNVFGRYYQSAINDLNDPNILAELEKLNQKIEERKKIGQTAGKKKVVKKIK